ncbi:hypothetical protein EVAR_11891_1 [Eumeta japonica]|uniref:Uncharacterized protein n=1 Tax=Eumeta variegata TaxID=151549 RepID=A0A4C1U7M0_EUMVA|nr:hypothetical protein EVAR_11891_1 [Eumeta japonica]
MNLNVILVLVTTSALVAAVPLTDANLETEPSSKTESIPNESQSTEETEAHETPQAVNENEQALENGDIQILLEDSYELPSEELIPPPDKDFDIDYVEPNVPVSPYNFYQNSMMSSFAEDEMMMEQAANIAAAFAIYKRKKYRGGRPRQAQRRYFFKNPYKRRVYYHAAKFSTISTSGYLKVTYEYNNKRTSRDKCAKTAARWRERGARGTGGVDPPEPLSGCGRSDNRRSTVSFFAVGFEDTVIICELTRYKRQCREKEYRVYTPLNHRLSKGDG